MATSAAAAAVLEGDGADSDEVSDSEAPNRKEDATSLPAAVPQPVVKREPPSATAGAVATLAAAALEGDGADADEEARGELAGGACSVLMKALWLARLARPDLNKAITDLACHIHK